MTENQTAANPAQPPVAAESTQLTERMGIVVTDWDPKHVVGTMPVAGNQQPYGLLHGGASAVLAETLGSLAAALAAGPSRSALGLELNVTHHRAASHGVVTGVCTPLHVGRTVASYQIAISDEAGRRVSTARLTCVLRNAPPPRNTIPPTSG
ncbi:MAG: 1,4-dihydroxy-2-naphthoyl-CoA hydrolase [Mycobacteriales bacterium]